MSRSIATLGHRVGVLLMAFVVASTTFAQITFAAPGDIGWTPIESTESSGNWESFASSSNGDTLVGVENGGYIYTSSDSGASWVQRTGAGSRSWYAAAVSANGKELVAAAYGGYIYTSIDSGVTWIERTSSGARLWRSVDSSADGTKLVAVDNLGYVYTSDDAGVTWTERTTSGARAWRSVAVSADGSRILAADNANGYLYTSTDSGATWTEHTSAGAGWWYAVDLSADGLRGIAGIGSAGGGYLYTTDDGGVTWTERTSAGSRHWRSVAMSNSGERLLAADYMGSGSGGYMYRSLDGGVSWTEQTEAGERWWVGVGSSADGSRVTAVAYDDTIYRLHRGVDSGTAISNFVLGTSIQSSSLSTAISQASISATGGLCAYIDSLSVLGLDGLDVSAPSNVVIIGGVAYSLSCVQQGASATVEIALGELYPDLAALRIYKKVGATLQDITSQITLVNKEVNGATKTVLMYTLTDGSAFDEDTTVNSTIVDPVYFGVVSGASTTTPGTSGLAATGDNTWLVAGSGLTVIVVSVLSMILPRIMRRRIHTRI